MGKRQIVYISLDEIQPYEQNPRKNDQAVEAVSNSIEKFGFNVPIIVDREKTIIAGHTRFKAAKKLGLSVVPTIIAYDLSPSQVKAFRLADNKTSEISEWDWNALSLELSEIENFDMHEFGFDEINVSPDDFGTDFSLNDADGPNVKTMTFTLSINQFDIVCQALDTVIPTEDDKNTNDKGNRIAEICRQWMRK